ncbi:hypothetical protein KQX54_015697 [Cotesia glomerata]|uniref:Uncharacterized protein n=1 Tax=Cotesia glomerata TaxID=32391 RepID=A0AAV7HWY9_COTGL|nr:hypothetical protein KQX54_015697 [Cotesia glomerata]
MHGSISIPAAGIEQGIPGGRRHQPARTGNPAFALRNKLPRPQLSASGCPGPFVVVVVQSLSSTELLEEQLLSSSSGWRSFGI